MKKVIFLAFLAVGFAGSLHSGTIVVTQPAGGNVTMGAAMPIVWTASGVVGEVKIQLIRPGGALVELLITNYDVGCLSWNWTVAAPAVAGESYRIRVRAVDDTAVGVSAEFTVVAINPVSTLSIVSPQGGESWELGSTQAISWIAGNIQENCRLVLLKDGQAQGTIRDSFAPGQGGGSWNWKVGDYPGGPAAAAGGYNIRIETVSGQGSAQSANPFAITPVQLVINPIYKVKAETKLMQFRPDLVVCLAWGGQIPIIYQDKRINVRIKNVGPGNAPAGSFKIYVEGHGDQIVPVPALAPKGEYSWSKKYDWKTCGHKTVRATIDPAGLIAESNENNNMLQGRIKVSCSLDTTAPAGYHPQVDRCSDQN